MNQICICERKTCTVNDNRCASGKGWMLQVGGVCVLAKMCERLNVTADLAKD